MSERNLDSHSVSVIIPAYNADQFIVEALDSIVRQTSVPKEVLVVDDGSSDRTFAVVTDWISATATSYPVKLIHHANVGVTGTRNAGIRSASGDWIAMLDSDDIWEPGHLEKLVNAANLVPGAVAAYGAGRVFAGTEVHERLYDEFWDNPSKRFGTPILGSDFLRIDRAIFARLMKGNFIKPSSLMVNKSAVLEIGLFDESLCSGEDRELLVRLIFKGDFVYCPDSITLYRWHDDNLSQTKNAKRNLENGLRVLNKIMLNKTLKLKGTQVAACRAEVRVATAQYLFVCAKAGFPTYIDGLKVVSNLFGRQRAVAALNPKNFVHALRA